MNHQQTRGLAFAATDDEKCIVHRTVQYCRVWLVPLPSHNESKSVAVCLTSHGLSKIKQRACRKAMSSRICRCIRAEVIVGHLSSLYMAYWGRFMATITQLLVQAFIVAMRSCSARAMTCFASRHSRSFSPDELIAGEREKPTGNVRTSCSSYYMDYVPHTVANNVA